MEYEKYTLALGYLVGIDTAIAAQRRGGRSVAPGLLELAGQALEDLHQAAELVGITRGQVAAVLEGNQTELRRPVVFSHCSDCIGGRQAACGASRACLLHGPDRARAGSDFSMPPAIRPLARRMLVEIGREAFRRIANPPTCTHERTLTEPGKAPQCLDCGAPLNPMAG